MAIPILAVPYIFIFQPALLLEGTLPAILSTAVFAFVGIFSLDVFITGYLFRRCSVAERMLFLTAGVLCCWPDVRYALAGAGAFAIGWIVQRMSRVRTA